MDGWEAAYTGVQRTRDWAAREKFGELGRRELGDLLGQVGKGGSAASGTDARRATAVAGSCWSGAMMKDPA